MLDHPGGRAVLARALEWRIRRLHGERVHVRFDADDRLWMFRWPDVAVPMVEPVPTSPAEFERAHADVFFQEYAPRAGDVVVDVGAGMGSELDLMCRMVGPRGRVYAIEADPLTFRCLQRRCELNGLDNAFPIHVAITHESGEALISRDGHHLGHRLIEHGRGHRVPALTLDDLVTREQIDRIDLLKVNIEGGEQRAFEGMRQSIALVRNAAVSCHDFVGLPTDAAVRAFLTANGFRLSARRADDDRPWARSWVYANRIGASRFT